MNVQELKEQIKSYIVNNGWVTLKEFINNAIAEAITENCIEEIMNSQYNKGDDRPGE